MARPLRLEYAGAVWHATSRGNEKGTIFHDDDDRSLFLRLLGRTVERFGWTLHAYVLMGNHYHLLLETPEPTLSKGMRELNGIYSQGFNVRHERVGHVMQGRFKGILVERQTHLLELTRYVVLNPVRAGIVAKPEDWPWSNYRATAGIDRAPTWLEVRWTRNQFGTIVRHATSSYSEFVRAGICAGPRPFASIKGQIFLGSEQFLREMRHRIERIPLSREVPREHRLPARPSMDAVLHAVADWFDSNPSIIRTARGGHLRAIAAYLARNEGLIRLEMIGEALLVSPSRAARLAYSGQRFIESDPALREKVEGIANSWRSDYGVAKGKT